MKITLTKAQHKVSQSKARFRVLISGRRFGKTHLAITESSLILVDFISNP